MKVNFNASFKDHKGKDLGKMISEAVCEALYAAGSTPEVLTLNREQKWSAYKIMNRILANPGEVEITTEESTLIKDITAVGLIAGAYGQIEEILERNGNNTGQ